MWLDIYIGVTLASVTGSTVSYLLARKADKKRFKALMAVLDGYKGNDMAIKLAEDVH